MSIPEYERWRSLACDAEIKDELAKMASSPEMIEEAFFRSLEFGTGGLRGIIGAGSNRMNIYTVRRATLGLAKYILEKKLAPSVAIGYDTRIKSREFAEFKNRAAEIIYATAPTELAANGKITISQPRAAALIKLQ